MAGPLGRTGNDHTVATAGPLALKQSAFVAMLERHGIAFVVADTPHPWPRFEGVTAAFSYMRLHGSTELYNSRYTHGELARWAALMRGWASAGRDVYCYFDNTDKLHAPDNARELMAMPGVSAETGAGRGSCLPDRGTTRTSRLPP